MPGLAQVLAVEPGKSNDGFVELSAGTERDKPWSELSREFSDALEVWCFDPLARRIVDLRSVRLRLGRAREAASDGRAIRWMVASDGPGIGLADFGEAEGAILAMGEQRR